MGDRAGERGGELRLYAVGIGEFRGLRGTGPAQTEELRAAAERAFAAPVPAARSGMIGKLGPLFRRVPAAPVLSPTQPEPPDVDRLLSGGYVPPERTGATWRVLEALTAYRAWGSTRTSLTAQAVDDLDFALARGGVSAAVGIRHLLGSNTDIGLMGVEGLTVGWHRHDLALAMAAAYRAAMPQIKTEEQRALVAGLVTWLDGFYAWADVAGRLGRPVPDLVGFWAH